VTGTTTPRFIIASLLMLTLACGSDICSEYYVGVACTPAELDSIYLACFGGTNLEYASLGQYFDGVSIDCDAAVDACL
jgi:hypothetical protein